MTFINTSGDFLGNFPEHTVDLIDRLTDPVLEWEPLESEGQVRRLFCDELILKCNGVDSARLSMDIGDDLLQIGDSAFAQWRPESIVGKYVRITITQADPIPNRIWVGYVKGVSQDRAAVKTDVDPDQNVLTGKKQFFECVGLAYFLDRVQVDTAVIRQGLGTDLRIYRPMIFNGDRSVNYDNDTSKRGNKFTLPQFDLEGDPESDGGNEDFAFTNGEQPGELWSAKDIVRHMLRYHAPTDKDDEPAPCRYSIQYRGDDDGDEVADDQTILASFAPTIPTERRSTLQILNDTIKAKRGVCWWTELKRNGFGDPITTPGFIEVKIRVATRAVTDITLPAGGTLPANVDQVEFNIDTQVDVEDFKLDEDLIRSYDQIIVRGARMTTTATWGVTNSNLESDWSSDLEDAYKEAISGGTSEECDTFRRAEVFNPVYSWFRIPSDWDGKTGDGIAPPTDWAAPVIAIDGTPDDESLPISVHGLRLLTTTRLQVGYDYSGDASNPTEEYEIPSTSTPDTKKPFAFISTGSGRIRYVDKLSKEAGPAVAELSTSYDLHIRQNVPGFALRARNGHAHLLAAGSWIDPPTPEATNFEPELSVVGVVFSITATAEVDRYAEAKWPETLDDVEEGKPVEKLTVYAGDKYRLDYLAPRTALALNNDDPDATTVVAATGGVIRNDQPELQNIARMAFEWYKVGRQPITVPFKHCKDVFRLGMLITNIGEGSTLINVNSVVSAITFDLLRGRMTIQTDDDDVDFSA